MGPPLRAPGDRGERRWPPRRRTTRFPVRPLPRVLTLLWGSGGCATLPSVMASVEELAHARIAALDPRARGALYRAVEAAERDVALLHRHRGALRPVAHPIALVPFVVSRRLLYRQLPVRRDTVDLEPLGDESSA